LEGFAFGSVDVLTYWEIHKVGVVTLGSSAWFGLPPCLGFTSRDSHFYSLFQVRVPLSVWRRITSVFR